MNIKTIHGFFSESDARKYGFATYMQPNGNLLDVTWVSTLANSGQHYVGEVIEGECIYDKVKNAKNGNIPTINGKKLENYDNNTPVTYWKTTDYWKY